MMKKQEFVPRKISEKPLYELKSVEDIPVSELYQVKVNGKEQRVYHTEFFDFVSFSKPFLHCLEFNIIQSASSIFSVFIYTIP